MNEILKVIKNKETRFVVAILFFEYREMFRKAMESCPKRAYKCLINDKHCNPFLCPHNKRVADIVEYYYKNRKRVNLKKYIDEKERKRKQNTIEKWYDEKIDHLGNKLKREIKFITVMSYKFLCPVGMSMSEVSIRECLHCVYVDVKTPKIKLLLCSHFMNALEEAEKLAEKIVKVFNPRKYAKICSEEFLEKGHLKDLEKYEILIDKIKDGSYKISKIKK